MGKDTGFMEYSRELAPRRPVAERVNDWFEIYQDFSEENLRTQGARCMDCGVPFCQTGCPVNNLIPDWNDLVYHGRWQEAVRQLHATNNFPELTGRICPAPCEASCSLGVTPHPVAAQQLCRGGHSVVVYEKAARIGGLLRYGIPEFKMEKHIIDRRLEQMSAEGVEFVTGAEVGKNVAVEDLRREFDAIVLAGGAEQPRDLIVPGRELKGIHFAMEYLPQQNRRNLGDTIEPDAEILATGKRVVIIGGGDTGADCLGTCHRQKPLSVQQFEIMPKPPEERSPLTPWPLWPMQLRVEGAHEEGGGRDWGLATTKFTGNGNVQQLHAVRVGPPPRFEAIPGTEFTMEAPLILIATGFVGPVRSMLDQWGVELDARGNVATDQNNMSSVPGVFAAGDMRRGQSLVVWAIAEGRKTAGSVDAYLGTKAMPRIAARSDSNSKEQSIAS